jgi:hypothetical protein
MQKLSQIDENCYRIPLRAEIRGALAYLLKDLGNSLNNCNMMWKIKNITKFARKDFVILIYRVMAAQLSRIIPSGILMGICHYSRKV